MSSPPPEPFHQWTQFETHMLVHILAQHKFQYNRDPMVLTTAFNRLLSTTNYESDISSGEIRLKIKEIVEGRPAFANMMMRQHVPKITRTLMRSYHRGLKFSGERPKKRLGKSRDRNTAGEGANGVGAEGEREENGRIGSGGDIDDPVLAIHPPSAFPLPRPTSVSRGIYHGGYAMNGHDQHANGNGDTNGDNEADTQIDEVETETEEQWGGAWGGEDGV